MGNHGRNRKNKSSLQRMRRRRGLHSLWLLLSLVLIAGIIGGCMWFLAERQGMKLASPYEISAEMLNISVNSNAQRAEPFAQELCVSDGDVETMGISLEEGQSGALFDLENLQVLYGKNLYEKIYPASMTKIMTGLLALENGNMDTLVTISQSAVTLEEGSQVCGFRAGDKVSMSKLIHGLLVYSGNDAAAAIAETIGGSELQFVEMMNQKARELGMSGTNFTNPHGLQEENHYTTVYDIYLMLNEAMKNEEFLSIVQLGTYTLGYEGEDGSPKQVYLDATDHYLTGEATAPKDVTVLGGKTGTTSEAGNCLALISQNAYGRPYVSIITNAVTKELLYQQMNQLLSKINS